MSVQVVVRYRVYYSMENKYFPSKKGEVIPKEAIVSRTERMYPEK